MYTYQNREKYDMGILKNIINYKLKMSDRERGQERKQFIFLFI